MFSAKLKLSVGIMNFGSLKCQQFFFTWFLWISVIHSEDVAKWSRKWREEYYRQMPIDHFSSNHTGTFDQRYLINDTWWSPGGPIFFYPCNEGLAEDFAEGTGIMWDWAPEFGAMLVFPEHRFYGKTLPYGKESFEHLETLTVEQAMEDYAIILNWLKKNITGAESSPIIAFGGSYGAMLAAWMRYKYPHLIQGVIASSAPIRHLMGGDIPCWSLAERATITFAKESQKCVDAIQRSWDVLHFKLKTEEGRTWLKENFRMCSQIREPHVEAIAYKINDAWLYMAMFDYPYPTNFLVPLPAWPVKEACQFLTSDSTDNDTFLLNVFDALSVYFNHSGTLKCLSQSRRCCSHNLEMWSYQTCTELIFAECSNGSDILLDSPWDEQRYVNSCATINARPKYDYLTQKYGVKKLKTSSNIVFTNGELDPWYSSGISQDQLEGGDPSLIAISLPNSAHHYDLRADHPNDTQQIIHVRKKLKHIVKSWLEKFEVSSNESLAQTNG